MEKLKRISIITILVLIVSAAVIFALLFTESGKTESIYQKALTAMDDNQWDKAYDLIQDVPHYKNAQEIEIYVYPIMTYYKEYSAAEEQLSAMEIVDTYIDENIDKLNEEDYKLKLSELKQAAAFQQERIQVLNKYNSETELMDSCVELIGNNELDQALEKLGTVNSLRFKEEKSQLLYYIAFRKAAALEDNNALRQAASYLNPAYTGALSEKIKADVSEKLDKEQWNKLYLAASAKTQSDNLNKNKDEKQKIPDKIVSIGVNRTMVIGTMGSPIKEDTINNSFGSFERLEYNGNIIVYLENGKVTAIKA